MDRDELDRQVGRGGRVVRRSDLVGAGIPSSSFHDVMRREGWQRRDRGVYVPPHVQVDATIAARAALANLAADGAWLARGSVLWLRGLLEDAPAEVQVVVHDRRQPARRAGVDVMRSRTLRADEHTVCRGLPCTTLARAVRDCCGTGWKVPQLLPLCLQAIQQRTLAVADLREQRRRMGRGCTGTSVLDELIAEVALDGSDSILERVGRDGARRRLAVQPTDDPFPWRAPDGVVDHLDIAWPHHWVCIFCDSRRYHGSGWAFNTDRRMWNAVSGSWRPFWLDAATARDEDRLDALLDDVAEALAAADPERPPAKRAACRCSHCLGRAR